uniref:60S acidic ribosomal protein P0 n=1 Tax=Paramoeba aestuarina TaxID=180227 RepID=A0A7S4JM11_9EUKA|mmetsp:Transcript_11628/g.17621  ORF Transcript_11628/g.17621 Transcript_11628/m.17621 type:complete len:324 (+) Transcript_11628:102-1073(+)
MAERLVPQKKLDYRDRLLSLMKEYSKILIIGADNVGSSHFQRIRASLRGDAVILMGKNTVVRKILRQNEKEFPQHAQLLPKLYGNLGFVFTNGDVGAIRQRILDNKVGAPARVGAIAPCDVTLLPGPTGLDPGQTSFLQALNIPTMIVKGQIEIKNEVELIKEGNKVSPSQAALLVKLSLRPFKYGLTVKYIFDEGAFFEAKVLDLSEEDLLKTFAQGVKNVACISLAMGYPTLASVPHSLSNAHKNIFHISLATSYPYKATEKIINLLENPEALQEAMAAAAASAPVAAAEDKKEEAAAVDEEEEEEDFGAGGLFGDDDDGY